MSWKEGRTSTNCEYGRGKRGTPSLSSELPEQTLKKQLLPRPALPAAEEVLAGVEAGGQSSV